MLGASAGSILSYARYREILNRYREICTGAFPETAQYLHPKEGLGFEVSKWTVSRVPNRGTPDLAGGVSVRDSNLNYLGAKAALAPLSENTLPGELDQRREAAR